LCCNDVYVEKIRNLKNSEKINYFVPSSSA